jgi:ABC-type glycerol-3-phosphate transport system substrate-binding protein
MNKYKIIFAIIWLVLVALIVLWALSLNSWSKNQATTNNNLWFNIWIMEDDKSKFWEFIEEFKKFKPKYKKKSINVESFSNYEEYSLALTSAIMRWKAPDLFVLNNNEKKSIFSNQVSLLDSTVINPNDFRKKFKWVFGDDLISAISDSSWKEKEFLIWMPVWYETLWVFYNRRRVQSSDLASLSSLNSIISKLKKEKPNLIPIGIGNGSTVYNISDIISQFFMLESWIDNLVDLTWSKLKQSLATYLLFWDEKWENAYNSRFIELKTLEQNNLNLFAKGETFMVIGYPRMIEKIHSNGFSKNFLRAEPFPHYYSWEWKTLLNYNYFVINKDTANYPLASDLLLYLSTDSWAWNYLSKYPYYLPALLSLESDILEEKINPEYNVVLENFHNPDFELSSFDKWIKNLYDRDIISILDNPSNYQNQFSHFRSKILCKTEKITSLEKLSGKCE